MTTSFDPLFTDFTTDVSDIALPEKFTFPFYYQPHPLCELAAQQLQAHLLTQTDWEHNFGLDDSNDSSTGTGKMFGVLIVQNSAGELGFLSAFSGKIADQNILPSFVPPVFDMLADESFFRSDLAKITDINTAVTTLSSNPKINQLTRTLEDYTNQFKDAEQAQRSLMIKGRADRKQKRKIAQEQLNNEELTALLNELGKESVAEKNQLKYLQLEWKSKIESVEQELNALTDHIDDLKQQRKLLSNRLQDKLFTQYQFLNADGEERSLKAIFAPTTNTVPPAGAGECAAPKLLHYAFKHRLKPLAMAEFWWGRSPKSEIRQHKKFYPSCNSKCQPILGHMLKGLTVDDNPLEENWAQDKQLEIIYEDEAMVVVNKPSGMLSVPGKTIKDSAYTRLQQRYPDSDPFVIHRLDMATSGLLVFALSKRANKSLQKQFIARTVKKRYIALLDGVVNGTEGQIDLPMRGDPVDRPRQLVCYQHGKPALTHWELIETSANRSKLRLYPQTGRTHQLRVHCAHQLGLGIPMVGDTLYGEQGDRLHLHAEYLEFDHPYTKEKQVFLAPVPF